MANYRRGRINDEMQKVIASVMREVKDPRVSGAFISITAVDVTPDLKFAKVFYSVLGETKGDVAKGLKAAAPFIRSCIAKQMNLRMTPELTFIPDTSIEYGAKISKIINSFEYVTDEEESEEENN